MVVNKAIFIDKDGTLIPDIPYNIKLEHISLSDNCVEGLAQLQQKGYLLIVISNQAGIAQGHFDENALDHVEEKIKALLQEQGVRLDGFYYCPHHPEAQIEKYRLDCDCRKPQPGLLFKAAADFNIDLEQSWMIGDILHDIEAGHHAGCRAILIHNGNETEWKMNRDRVPDALVDTIDQAAMHIMKSSSAYSLQIVMNKLMIASSPLKNKYYTDETIMSKHSQIATNIAHDSFITVKKQIIFQ